MNILYGIQGTGHGHISRAKEILPQLGKHAEVDVLVSGYNCKLDVEQPVRFRKYGISMTYDSNGGVSILGTLHALKPFRFLTDINTIPVKDYDLVISDYEPVSAWAARSAGIPSIALSHQAAFLSDRAPRPAQKSIVAESILQHFAPADYHLGFHFKRYDRFIEPPIIRSEIKALAPTTDNHVTVYLPAYDDRFLAETFRQFTEIDWHIFSPGCTRCRREQNVSIFPVSNDEFLKSFESCMGVITGAGFETCAEAMYLGKKLLSIPIRNQYEQLCNAAALEEMGISTLDSIHDDTAGLEKWLSSGKAERLKEAADPDDLISKIFSCAFGRLPVGEKEYV